MYSHCSACVCMCVCVCVCMCVDTSSYVCSTALSMYCIHGEVIILCDCSVLGNIPFFTIIYNTGPMGRLTSTHYKLLQYNTTTLVYITVYIDSW